MKLQTAYGYMLAGMIALLCVAAYANPAGPSTIEIRVDPQQRFQYIDGFGVNFNATYFRSSQKPLIDMLVDDLGATIFRLDPYGQSNWEVQNDNDDAHSMNWEYYNDRYTSQPFEASWKAARYLNIRGARVFLTLSGTAPKWMLDNDAPSPKHHVCRQEAGIGPAWAVNPVHLSAKMYGEFAEEVVSMVMYARNRARVKFEYLSPLNENDCYPAEGSRIDPEEMPKVQGAIAERLRKEGLGDVKLVVTDQANLKNDYFTPILHDTALMKQVGAFSLHTYDEQSIAPQVARVRSSKYPNVPVWLTEYGDLDDLDRSAENDWRAFSLTATRRALHALNDGATVALYWDAFDNYHEHYPRLTFYGLVQNADAIYTPKKRYYAARQLYHYVHPGSQRIAASVDSADVVVSAFRDAGQESLIVVGAKKGSPGRVRVSLPASLAPAAWELYETTRQLDCRKVDRIAVRDGVAEFDLPGEAIFTLVGRLSAAGR